MPESRQILGATGRMVHGQVVEAHVHAYGQLLHPATGVLTMTTDRGTWVAPAHRVLWIPPGFRHAHRAYGTTEVRRVEPPPRFGAVLPAEPSIFAVTPLLHEALRALSDDRPLRPGPRHRLHGVVVDELTGSLREELHLPEPVDSRLRALTAILHADPGDRRTLGQLGRQVGASERVLSRLFASEVGMSFRQWRIVLRVQHALVLLGEGHAVTTVALQLGWSNPTSFIDAFVALVHETPGQYQAGLRHARTWSSPGRRRRACSDR